ncbi:MAG TPA: UvrD-helicase domain-containing protein [Tepidisphaeraceae bacterium]|jgi:DNA helicase-2/ATP-dependent DNA helicase PcrA|nr:UvrD-helicase domain-containing protein [Tepidisphaeraceae bacterium]
MRLNPEQEAVASHVHGRILTLAGPGSGKTRTLTERTGRLVRGGVNPANILCLTFTNKARDEMRDRLSAQYGEKAKKVSISNFHGLCGIILRKFGAALGYSAALTICDSDDQVDLLMQVARKRGIEPTKPQARALAFAVNDWRENLGGDDSFHAMAGEKIRDGELDIMRAYLEALRRRNQCDFSGMLSETVRLLREHGDVREKLQNRFQFIQVDEFQDTNRAQHEIVELICGKDDNVLAVGDGDQSIYEWRGASPDGIDRFIKNGKKKTGKCRIVKLGVNYRSTPQVIEVADRLIKHSTNRIPVEFSTVHAAGEPVKLVKFEKPEFEAEAVAMDIEKLVRRESVPAKEIAVFYRQNDMSRLIEQSLAKRQIPYQVVGSGSYYDRMEVKDVLSMLRFVCNPKDGISFARIANKPARGMGDALIGRLETFAEKFNVDLLHAMSDEVLPSVRDEHDKPLSDAAIRACKETRAIFDAPRYHRNVADIVNDLLDRTKYDTWLKERYEEKGEYESRSRNVNELANSIAEFARTNPRATVAEYLESISLYTNGDEKHDGNAVRLMSLHASKGLEFDVVYIIGVEHGILPHEKAIKDRADRGLEEERRLCYVGFTRARKLLRVAWCQTRQDAFSRDRTARFLPTLPSQFLHESGLMSPQDYAAAKDKRAEAIKRSLQTSRKKKSRPPERP